MKHKGNFSIKLAISAILILIFMISIAFFMQESQAATGYAVVANEKSLVRMTAGLVLGGNSDRTVTRDQVATKLTDYILASKTTVTDDTTRDVIIVKYTDSSNEYEIVKGSKYTIKYDTNGTGVTGMPANQVKGHGQSITLTAASPTRDGYRFKGWSTVSTDTTGSYQPGDTYSANASITLYAIWQKKYTISYDANGGSGAPSAQTKWHDEALTLSSTKPTWSNHKFLGWAESSTATTAAYQPGASFTGNKNVTLYAVWHEMYTISYNLNGGTGTSTSQTKEEDVAITLHAAPTRTGYVFGGWKSSATSSTYTGGSSFTENNTTTLTAQWTENYLTVNYYSNYADAAISSADNAVSATTNVLVQTVKYYYDNAYSSGLNNYTNTSSTYLWLTRTGYTGTGNWGTSTSGGTLVSQSTSFDTGQALAEAFGKDISSANASINVYAQWTAKTVKVTFYRNYTSSDTTTATETFTYGVSGQKFSKSWTRTGYSLLGWANSRSATAADYSTASGVTDSWINTNSPNKSIYAVWKQKSYTATPLVNQGWVTIFSGSQSVSMTLTNGHKYYVKSRGGDYGDANGYGPISCDALGIYAYNNENSNYNAWISSVNGVYSFTGTTGTYSITATFAGYGTNYSGNYYVWFYCYVYDLTAIFGAGNEPDQSWCSSNLTGGSLNVTLP